MARALILIWAAVAMALVGDAAAAQSLPPGAAGMAVAWWDLDPTPLGDGTAKGREAGAAVLESALRIAISGGLVKSPSDSDALKSLLAASTIATTPHTLCIIDLNNAAGEPAVQAATDAPRLGVVLELRSRGDHKSYIRTLEAVLAGHAHGDAKGVQRPLSLPRGRAGVAYTEPGWPEWREVSWSSLDDRFLVGLGRGALEAWLTAADAPASPALAPWGSVAPTDPPRRQVFRAFVDLDALRRLFPDQIGAGSIQPLLEDARLCNARWFMLHAGLVEPENVATRDPAVPVPPALRGHDEEPYAGPPLLAIEASWKVRSEDPEGGPVHRLSVGKPFWPRAEIGMSPPAGPGFTVVARVDLHEAVQQCLALRRAALAGGDLAAFDAERASWEKQHTPALDRLAAAGQWLILAPVPAAGGSGGLLGPLAIWLPLRPGVSGDAVQRDLMETLKPWAGSIESNKRSNSTTLVLADQSLLLRAVAWGIAAAPRGPVLVGGMDLGAGGGMGDAERKVVERARELIKKER